MRAGAFWLVAVLALGACVRPLPLAAPASHAGASAERPRILSLNPCTDAIIAEVADREQIVALSDYSGNPLQSSMNVALARSLPATHGTVEEVVLLQPDLVLSGNMTAPATRAAFARLGLPLVEQAIPRSVAESEAAIRQIARLAGHEDRGEALISRIRASLASAAPPPGEAAIPALVWQGGGMVPGPDTLIAELLARTGFASFSAQRGLGQAQILPLERVLADPPAVILAAGHEGQDRLLAHPALARLAHTRRIALDPALEWCGGPTIIRAAARLAQIRQSLGKRPAA